ncbi:hypothetical protein HXZ66_10955 [Bacillus sp. A116_S68]|nr:hypothetical protein HXZ66_10955 [Bacillus sp. A116_S68]
MFAPASYTTRQDINKETLQIEYEKLEFQLLRMQENLKQIAKKWSILGIEQTKLGKWTIIYASDNGEVCKIMAHDCETPFNGTWDFSIHASYKEDFHIQIDDIRGEQNQGFGSVCMSYFKQYIEEQNMRKISGYISPRDWSHLERLLHFYKKHDFSVSVDYENQQGTIDWQPF